LAESLAITAFNSVHGAAGTWLNQVDTYIALSEFARRKFIEGGIPPSQITVKPNCVPDPGPPSPFPRDGTILYVGRLTAGKGVADLLESLAMLKLHDRLRVVGDGEEADRLRKLAKARGFPRGAFLGALYGDAVVEQIRAATCLVIPSRHYETFGRTVIESFACGRPVVASRRGSLPELVEPGCTGYLFEGGDAGSLAAALQNLVGSPDGGAAMGREAREVWSRKYSPEPNVRMLASIYRMTLERLGMRVPERLAVLSECV
jgi:glycosyltransferase involved in cell wall biosynthesis